MKKFIIPVICVLCLAGAVILVLLGMRLLRPEAHRGRVEQALSGSFDADAKVGRLAFLWSGGNPTLNLQKLQLQPKSQEGMSSRPGFSADSVRLVLDLPALFKRELHVRSVRFDHPKIEVIRTARGVTAGGLRYSGEGAKDPLGWGKFSWSVDRLILDQAELLYRDAASDPVREAAVSSLDMEVRLSPPGRGLKFEGKAGVLTRMPNAVFAGSLDRDPGSAGWSLQVPKIRVGLGEIPIQALERAFPILMPLGLRGRLAGALSGSLQKAVYDGRQLAEFTGSMRIEGAKFFIRMFKSPVSEFNIDTHFDRDTVVISSLDGQTAHGTFRGRGEIRNLDKPDPDASFEFRSENVNLSELFPRPSAGRPQLTGRASLEISGNVQGRTRDEWLRSLRGEGRAALADGVLANTNLLRMIFDKLAASMPGAQDAFARTMPPDIGQKLSLPDTYLAPLEIAFYIGNGGIAYSNFRIAGDGFEIVGTGQQGFGGDIDFKTTLVLDQRVSSYILYCCPDASAIADSYGRLIIPVRIAGTIRNVKIEPDTNYLMRKILGVKAPEYLMKALQGKV